MCVLTQVYVHAHMRHWKELKIFHRVGKCSISKLCSQPYELALESKFWLLLDYSCQGNQSQSTCLTESGKLPLRLGQTLVENSGSESHDNTEMSHHVWSGEQSWGAQENLCVAVAV